MGFNYPKYSLFITLLSLPESKGVQTTEGLLYVNYAGTPTISCSKYQSHYRCSVSSTCQTDIHVLVPFD